MPHTRYGGFTSFSDNARKEAYLHGADCATPLSWPWVWVLLTDFLHLGLPTDGVYDTRAGSMVRAMAVLPLWSRTMQHEGQSWGQEMIKNETTISAHVWSGTAVSAELLSVEC